MRLPRPATENDRGAVIPLVALVLVVLITMCAIAVDLGRLMVTRRDLQADADVISLDLVRHVDGRTRDQIENNSSPAWSNLITFSSQRNDIDPANVVVDLGVVDATTRVYTSVGASAVPNAVKVTTTGSINYFFKPGGGTSTRSAVATVSASACYDVGSYALSLSTAQSTVLQQLTNGALGGNLTLIGYQGLANANLSLAQLLAAQTSAGTVNQLLTQSITMNQLQVMYVQALNNSGQTAAATILNSQVFGASGNRTVTLGQVLNVQSGTGTAASTQFNVLDMLAGAAYLANGTNFLSIPNLGLTIPGLVSAGLNNFKLIQGPESSCYPNPPYANSVTTSQASIPLTLGINVKVCTLVGSFPLLGPLLGALTCVLDPNAIRVATVELNFDIAQSAASMTSVTCSLTSKSATITVNSNLIVPRAKVTLLGLTLMDSSLAQTTPVGGGVSFAYPGDVGPPTTKATGSGSLGFNNLSLGGALGTAIDPTLQLVLQALQPSLFGPLGDSLGVRIAGADVTLQNLDCTAPKLVG